MSDYSYEVPEDLKPYIPGYLQRREEDVKFIYEHFERQNWFAIGAIIHKIRGNAAGYGFARLGEIADRVQDGLDLGDEQSIASAIEDLAAEVKQIRLSQGT